MRVLLLLFSLALLSSSKILSTRHHRHPSAEGEIHALLVAGSNGWYNYRHQADVGHAYHTLKRHGIADENIIVMMYDDIAHNKQNPYPGKMFNRPHGDNVYEGLKIDYKGSSVTPKNFLNILKGNASGVEGGNGRVIESNPNDRIFVFFTDHGAVGVIAFPDEMLTVKELNNALNWMHSNNRYDQLVFYLESCESGSMFENVLKSTINVYAITAANSHESSWGTFCENDMRLPCLGDLFSVNWMKDSDEEDINVETIEDQYKLVKRLTNLSHVMHFGDMKIGKEPVGWFQGQRKAHKKRIGSVDDKSSRTLSWPSRDVELMYLHQLKDSTNDIYVAKELSRRIRQIHEVIEQLLGQTGTRPVWEGKTATSPSGPELAIVQDRRAIKSLVLNIIDSLVGTLADRRRILEERNTVENLDCHDEVVRAFDLICVDVNKYEYALKYFYVLNNLCIEIGDAEQIMAAMWTACSRSRFQFF